jgi:hypothetical protein
MKKEFYSMNYENSRWLELTRKYYSSWLDFDLSQISDEKLIFKESCKRDKVIKGYGKSFPLYCYLEEDTRVVSYSKILEVKLEEIKRIFQKHSAIPEVKEKLETLLGGKLGHNKKFYYTKKQGCSNNNSIQLKSENYNDYLAFFNELHPKVKTDWLEEYFLSLIERGYCWGYYENGKLVCFSDAPDIPYMNDIIVEPGINTLEEHRKKGFAKEVIMAFVNYLLQKNKVPIWSCSSTNKASMALANSAGFNKLADVITFSN